MAETVTAASLDAMESYSIAQDLSSTGRQEESIEHYQKAIAARREFRPRVFGLATVLFNLDRRDEAAALWKTVAVAHGPHDRTGEIPHARPVVCGTWRQLRAGDRELREARGALSSGSSRAEQSGVRRTFSCSISRRRWITAGARSSSTRRIRAHARTTRFMPMYAGDLKTAEAEARIVLEQSKTQYKAYLPLVAVAFASGDFAAVASAYEGMRGSGVPGATVATHGLADLAMYQGRWADAGKLLEDGIAADEKSNERLARAAKLTALAEVYLAQNRAPQAVRAVQEALAITREDATLVPAALVLVRAGRRAEAQSIADGAGPPVSAPAAAPTPPSSRATIARTAGRSVEARTRSTAPENWRTCGWAGSCSVSRTSRVIRVTSTCPRRRSSSSPRSAAVRRSPSFSTTCRRSDIWRHFRTGWVEPRKASTKPARRRLRTIGSSSRCARTRQAIRWPRTRGSG